MDRRRRRIQQYEPTIAILHKIKEKRKIQILMLVSQVHYSKQSLPEERHSRPTSINNLTRRPAARRTPTWKHVATIIT